MLVVVGAETGLRLVVGDDAYLAEYWHLSAAVKWERYLNRLDKQGAPDYLIIGDSTAARDISPEVMLKHLGQPATAYNLGADGNHQLAMRADTLPLLSGRYPVPKVVVYSSVVATIFEGRRSYEQAIVCAPIGRRLQGRPRLSDYLLLVGARVLRIRRGTEVPQTELGFMPLDRHRPGDDLANLGTGVVYDGAGRPKPNPERVAVLDKLAEDSTRTGFRLVFVIPPARDDRLKVHHSLYRQVVDETAAKCHAVVLDYFRDPSLTADDFADMTHLRRAGAEKFSALLAADLQAALRAP